MEKIILWTSVSFELNAPNPDDGGIRENFDFSAKPACVTIGVGELIGEYVQARKHRNLLATPENHCRDGTRLPPEAHH